MTTAGRADDPETRGIDRELLDILACPACRGDLKCSAGRADESLYCISCGRIYPVRNGIPVLVIEKSLLPQEKGK